MDEPENQLKEIEPITPMEDCSSRSKLISTILLLEQYARLVISDDERTQKAMLPELTSMLTEIMPIIIRTYQSPKLTDLQDECTQWMQQLNRIMETIAGDDVFAIADVLYFEMAENLRYFRQLIEDRGIEL